MLSTPVCDAASISIKSTSRFSAAATHFSHFPHGFAFCKFSQFNARAINRAAVVLPTPRVPENKSACDILFFFKFSTKIFLVAFCPTKSSKVCGRYFRAKFKFQKLRADFTRFSRFENSKICNRI